MERGLVHASPATETGHHGILVVLQGCHMHWLWVQRSSLESGECGGGTLPMEDSDQVHGSQVHILGSNVFRAQDPLCSCPPGKPPPNLPFGCLHQPLFRNREVKDLGLSSSPWP